MGKRMRRWVCGTLAAAAVPFLAAAAIYSQLPDTIYLPEQSELALAQMPWLTPLQANGSVQAEGGQNGESYNATLGLWGVVPIKTVRVVQSPRRVVMVSGAPFGIKMFSDGALVVGFSDILGENGYCNPAREAGVKLGDRIISVEGAPVHSNDELSAALKNSQSDTVNLQLERDDQPITLPAHLQHGTAGKGKLGVWVRDSSAGIGTMTFWEQETGRFAGLGHAISDTDTGRSIALLSGEVSRVNITGFAAGAPGLPGELKGEFLEKSGELGKIASNQAQGVYGTLTETLGGTPYEVAAAQEITKGPAQILTTISGTEPQYYDVVIERIALRTSDPNKNMILRVTDKRLLDSTAGIVQGMSGSPILQNGRLVGAVTHVLVNDPTRGYGIFAQEMIGQMDAVEKMEN